MVKSGALWGISALSPYNMGSGDDRSTYYNALYRHGVDEKRRVQIPAKWRPEGDATFTLMLWKRGGAHEPCLLVLPPELMRALADKLKQMPFGDPKAEALRRLLGAHSDQVTVDRSG